MVHLGSATLQEALEAMHHLATSLVAEDRMPAVVTNGRVASFVASPPDALEFEVMGAVAMRLQPGDSVQRIMHDAQDSGRTKLTGDSEAGACTAWPRRPSLCECLAQLDA
jgi:hypothetical protein